MKHTPDKWFAEGNSVFALNKKGHNRMAIAIQRGCGCGCNNADENIAEQEANATLIAAAPMMYEELKHLFEKYGHVSTKEVLEHAEGNR